MAAAIWMVLAVTTMIGIFAVCVAVVVVGIRVFERTLAKHRDRRAAGA